MTLTFTAELSDVTPGDLAGFFVGWPRPPTAERLLDVLRGSARVWLARATAMPLRNRDAAVLRSSLEEADQE